MIFLAVGRILVFVAAFFCQNSNYTSIEKCIFAAFGRILVLVAGFFY